MSKKVILASNSKTRALMLKNAGLEFDIQAARVDEDTLKTAMIADFVSPRDIADALAELKARAVSYLHSDALVIGADQLLVKDGVIFSKANNRHEAETVLRTLSNSEHTLISAVTVYQNGQPIWRELDTASLLVRPLSDGFIEEYLDKLGADAFWSVGCYQLEGLGAQLFTKVEGDHFTILGLPLLPLLDFLRRHGCMPL